MANCHNLTQFSSIFVLGVGLNLLFALLKELLLGVRHQYEEKIESLENILRLSRQRLGAARFFEAKSILSEGRQEIFLQEQNLSRFRLSLTTAGILFAIANLMVLIVSPAYLDCTPTITTAILIAMAILPPPILAGTMFLYCHHRYRTAASLIDTAQKAILAARQ